MDSPEIAAAAEQLHGELSRAGLEVLFDDRNEPPGVKFYDADLIGLPLRLVISRRTVGAGTIEIKRRTARQPDVVPRDDVVRRVIELVRPATPAGRVRAWPDWPG